MTVGERTMPVRLAVVDQNSARKNLGACFRRMRSGPELEMLDAFLRNVPLHVPRGCRATAFREPSIESGYPDLVIVVWRESVARDWAPHRKHLGATDFRVMQFIYHSQRVEQDEILRRFGKNVTRNIERLADAKMIHSRGNVWVPYTLRRLFAAVKIIAIEAKIGKWTDVMNQALLNTWFASKSYVLVRNHPTLSQLAHARQRGIGVCSLGDNQVHETEGESTELPRSYASWAFNDWAWKSTRMPNGRVE